MRNNSLASLCVNAQLELKSPHASYQIVGADGDLSCTIEGKGWLRDLWQLRKTLLRRTNRRRFSDQLHETDLRLEVTHCGEPVARIGRGVKSNLAARLLGLPHGEVYLFHLMH